MEKGKVVLGGGVVAFLVSCLVGITAGVGFLTLLFRAILGGAFFSGLLFVSLWAIQRFLPELFQVIEDTRTEANRVDLVIPEHNPHQSDGSKDSFLSPQEPKEFEDFVEEIEEVSKPMYGADPKKGIETLSIPSENEASSSKEAGKPELDELDSLPDLGKFGDSFSEISTPEILSGTAEGTLGAEGQDPAVLAKAVQTLLKRDKEG
ncbi:MAG TPA: hypothetical protein PLG79_03465 [Spirochaetales bacterium]|nr:hypothetical protein [Spirochaetales bacterium]HOV37756.1 hypothetical protein [Spirochaetales bacterium]